MRTRARSSIGIVPLLAPIVPAIIVGALAFAWLSHVNPPMPLTDDGIRDQLLTRDCTDLGRCHRSGADASYEGFYHGAAWLDLLVAVRLLGGDTSSQRTVVLALLAASAATLFVVVWRWLRPSIALPAAVLFIGLLSLDRSASMLINPSASALPDVAVAAGLLCFGLSGQRRFLMVSAFALGVAVDLHIASLPLGATLLVIAAAARPSPWPTLFVSAGIALGAYAAMSSAALRANTLALAGQGRIVPAIAAALVLVLLSVGLGSRFRRLSWDARAWWIGILSVAPFVLASLWLVVVGHHHFAPYYLHPILGPVATLAAAVLAVPFELGARRATALRWLPSAAAVVGLAVVTAVRVPSDPNRLPGSDPWSLEEAALIAGRAVRRGWDYEELVFRLQSEDCRKLLGSMSVVAPPPRSPRRGGRRHLQVVKVDREDLAGLTGEGEVVPLGPDGAAVLREVDSWLLPDSLTACRLPVGNAEPPRCRPAIREAPDDLARGGFLFARRSFPEIHDIEVDLPYVARYVIPLAPEAGAVREIALTDRGAPGCAWRITQVGGVRVDGSLPARRARLLSDTGTPGVLVVEKPFGTAACGPDDPDLRYPPCVLESRPGDPLIALAEMS